VTRKLAMPDEIAALVAHLRTSNVAWLVPQIMSGALTVWRDEIIGREAFGALDTFFANLGSGSGQRIATRITGRRFFRVSEARQVWRESTGDEEMYQRLEQYIEDGRANRLRDRTITLLDVGTGAHIVDGDKRAIAIYEASVGQDDLNVPIYVLSPRAR
jgi:hypothetical protein